MYHHSLSLTSLVNWVLLLSIQLAKLHVVVDVQNDNGKMKAMRAVYKCRG